LAKREKGKGALFSDEEKDVSIHNRKNLFFFSDEPSNCKQLVMNNKQYSNEEIDVSLFTTEKLSSSELYNHWNYNKEKKPM